MKILIVEDDARVVRPLKEYFEHQDNSVWVAADGVTALSVTRAEDFDVILVDLMLPQMDGMELCKTLRTEGCEAAIFIVTALSHKTTKIKGFDAGADDFIEKPFDFDELSARIRAFFRRNSDKRANTIRCGELEMNQQSMLVTFRGQAVNLTPTEYRLLNLFMRNPTRTYQKEELINRLWGHSPPAQSVIKAHIKGLRLKLTASGAPKDTVSTVYGFGYRLKQFDTP